MPRVPTYTGYRDDPPSWSIESQSVPYLRDPMVQGGPVVELPPVVSRTGASQDWQSAPLVTTEDWRQAPLVESVYRGSPLRQGMPTPQEEALGSLETETFPGHAALFEKPSQYTAINALKAIGSAILPKNMAQVEEMLVGGKVLGKIIEQGNKLPILGESLGSLINRFRPTPKPDIQASEPTSQVGLQNLEKPPTQTMAPELIVPPGGSQGPKIPASEPFRAPTMANQVKTALSEATQKMGRVLPQDLAVLKAVPNSPVISEVERLGVNVADAYYELANHADMKALAKIKPAIAEQMIDRAVETWIAGGRSPRAYAEAVSTLPPELQRLMSLRSDRLAMEQALLERRGLEAVPVQPGPYIPRSVTGRGNEHGTMQAKGAGLAEARSSIGPSAEERFYETIKEGQAAGVKYDVPLKGILKRELASISLEETDALITRLEEQRVIFPTRQQALAASPTGKVYELQGLPFGPKAGAIHGEESPTGSWWVRTQQEGKFLEDNLKRQQYNQTGEFVHYANQLIRNPSLVIPAIHVIKNMGLKMLAGVKVQDMPGVIGDAVKFRYQRDALDPTLVAKFEDTMAFSQYGKTPEQITQETVPFNPASAADYIRKPVEKIGLLNAPSARSVFTRWDPAMRFGRWKDYVDHGMDPQEAANNTWIDLVRYGQRSTWLDAIREIPMNFFATWRTGVPQSLYKNMRNAAFTTGAFVGLMDYLREIDLRQTASTTHLYWDYLEKPLASLAKSVEEEKPGEAAGKAVGITAATGIFGPGGAEFVARNYEVLFHVLQGKGDSQELQRMIYLIAQAKGGLAYYKAWEESGYKDMTQPLNIIATATIGRHPASTMPDRFAKYLPEWLPYMTKSEKYTDLENADARREVQKNRQEMRQNRSQLRRENALQEQIRSSP